VCVGVCVRVCTCVCVSVKFFGGGGFPLYFLFDCLLKGGSGYFSWKGVIGCGV